MKAVVWQKSGNIEICDVPKPSPENKEVLVRVKVATFCKTDLIKIERGTQGVKLPIVLGHEVSGVVEALGEGVEGLAVGQLVALDPPVPCYECRVCKSGLTHMCPNFRHIGSQIPGGMAEYITIDYRNAHLVPQGVSPAAASLAEPFAVSLEAISQGGGVKGKTVCVFGDGIAIYLALPVDTRTFKDIWARQLAMNLIDLLDVKPWLETNAPSTVEVVLNQQGDRYLLHLINHWINDSPYGSAVCEGLPPGIKVYLDAGKVPFSRATVVPSGEEIPITKEDGRMVLTLPRIKVELVLELQ